MSNKSWEWPSLLALFRADSAEENTFKDPLVRMSHRHPMQLRVCCSSAASVAYLSLLANTEPRYVWLSVWRTEIDRMSHFLFEILRYFIFVVIPHESYKHSERNPPENSVSAFRLHSITKLRSTGNVEDRLFSTEELHCVTRSVQRPLSICNELHCFIFSEMSLAIFHFAGA